MAVQTLTLSVSPEANLSRYLREIQKIPMLTEDEELSLANRWIKTKDHESAHKLVNSHLRLVAKIAMGYRAYGLPVGELISEGNVGMMKAVKRFDPERGFRFSTYALFWIRAAIQEYVLHSWSLVKMGTTTAQKKLFFNLRRLKIQMKAMEEGDLNPENVTAIAERLNVSEKDVISMNRRMARPDYSLNTPLRQDGDDGGEWMDWLVEKSDNQEETLAAAEELDNRRRLLNSALSKLKKRERHIFRERRLKNHPATLNTLCQEYNISRERVRQIEVRAFEKLQRSVRNTVIEQKLAF